MGGCFIRGYQVEFYSVGSCPQGGYPIRGHLVGGCPKAYRTLSRNQVDGRCKSWLGKPPALTACRRSITT
jgi:hypothetical protein